MSEQHTMPKQIAEAIIQMMIKVGYVQKKGVNKFQDYKYASIEGILEKVQPALVDCGLCIVQNEVSHDIVGEGNLMEAVYEFTLVHSSGVQATPIKQTGLSSVRNSKGGYDDKALNKCHTSARKYFILGLFQIPTGLAADPDDEEDKPQAAKNGAAEPPPRVSTQATRIANDGKNKAIEYANNAHHDLGKMKKMEELNAWLAKNTAALEKLKDVVPGEFAALDDKINVTADRLNSLVAG